jgi:hypothetical protein
VRRIWDALPPESRIGRVRLMVPPRDPPRLTGALHLAATGDHGFERRLRLGAPLLAQVGRGGEGAGWVSTPAGVGGWGRGGGGWVAPLLVCVWGGGGDGGWLGPLLAQVGWEAPGWGR